MSESLTQGCRVHRVAAINTCLTALTLAVCAWMGGCRDNVRPSPAEDLVEFRQAGVNGPSVDMESLTKALIAVGPYRVVPGDVLQIEMGVALDLDGVAGAGRREGRADSRYRVDDAGRIVLPIVGQVSVADRSLVQIESAVRDAYYPVYVKSLFPVYASVAEYKTYNVSIVGSVPRPGIQALRHDQMSLVALLMQAGGLAERGAALISITRQADAQSFRHNAGPAPESAELRLSQYGESFEMLTRGEDPLDVATVAFTPTGPLVTSGWLRIENHGKTIVQDQLDIGSMLQRARCLETLATRDGSPAVVELQRELAQLAHFLETRAYTGGGVEPPKDWVRAGGGSADAGVFVAEVSAASGSVGREARRVARAGTRQERAATLVLPVKGLNIPFADVTLQEGDAVVVEAPREQFVSVVGLVSRPGNFPYPPTASYTLIQAMASAGGLDLAADPRYVSVYRLEEEGTIAAATVQLIDPRNERQLTEALSLPLKPGDVVSVEHTPRTRTNVFFDRVFRVSLGLYLNPDSLLNDE